MQSTLFVVYAKLVTEVFGWLVFGRVDYSDFAERMSQIVR